MAINRTPVLKRCRQLGIDPVVLGYTARNLSASRSAAARRSEYGMQLREKQKAQVHLRRSREAVPRLLQAR